MVVNVLGDQIFVDFIRFLIHKVLAICVLVLLFTNTAAVKIVTKRDVRSFSLCTDSSHEL